MLPRELRRDAASPGMAGGRFMAGKMWPCEPARSPGVHAHIRALTEVSSPGPAHSPLSTFRQGERSETSPTPERASEIERFFSRRVAPQFHSSCGGVVRGGGWSTAMADHTGSALRGCGSRVPRRALIPTPGGMVGKHWSCPEPARIGLCPAWAETRSTTSSAFSRSSTRFSIGPARPRPVPTSSQESHERETRASVDAVADGLAAEEGHKVGDEHLLTGGG